MDRPLSVQGGNYFLHQSQKSIKSIQQLNYLIQEDLGIILTNSDRHEVQGASRSSVISKPQERRLGVDQRAENEQPGTKSGLLCNILPVILPQASYST